MTVATIFRQNIFEVILVALIRMADFENSLMTSVF